MFKIYDTDKNFISLIDICKDPCITTSLKTGLKTLSFRLPLTNENLSLIAEEYYIETKDYNYVVKEINFTGNDYFSVFCSADIEDLKALVPVFDTIDINVEDTIKKLFSNNQWKVLYGSNRKDQTFYKKANTTIYDLLTEIKHDYNLEFFYDTKKKILYVEDALGKEVGAFFSNELKLNRLTRQGQSYDFYTVIYPIGKNGLTIGVVNNGVNMLENYTYCKKYIPKYWIQDDIEHAEELKALAQGQLNIHSRPIVSYSLDLSSLPPDIGIGDNITLIDKIKKIKQKQRVVKIIQYPYNPEKDKVELSNQIVNFADTFINSSNNYDKQIQYIKQNLSTLL